MRSPDEYENRFNVLRRCPCTYKTLSKWYNFFGIFRSALLIKNYIAIETRCRDVRFVEAHASMLVENIIKVRFQIESTRNT